jgi:hypothetical protein
MASCEREWLMSSSPMQVEAIGRTWATRIPATPTWSAVAVLHPFEGDAGQSLRWNEADKSSSADDIELHTVLDRSPSTPGELDPGQALNLLQILCPTPGTICLAFSADMLVTPSSDHTSSHRDCYGRIDETTTEPLHDTQNRYLIRKFDGSGSDLLKSLRVADGWIEWPSLMWPAERSWMIDSQADLPFTDWGGGGPPGRRGGTPPQTG